MPEELRPRIERAWQTAGEFGQHEKRQLLEQALALEPEVTELLRQLRKDGIDNRLPA